MRNRMRNRNGSRGIAWLAGLMLMAMIGTAAAADSEALASLNGQLRVGMECAYAPSNWQEMSPSDTNVPIENVPGGYAQGYDVQFARIIADHLGLKLVIVKMGWDGLIPVLDHGQIDAIIAGMMDTAERRQAVNFSETYSRKPAEYAMMVNAGSKYESAKNIQDFSGASVLGQKDTALDSVIDQIQGVNHLPGVSSVPDMLARLREGACDALVINAENGEGYMASTPTFRVVRFEKEEDGFVLPSKGSCVGIRKTDEALLALVNEAVTAVPIPTRLAMWAEAEAAQPR